MIEMTLEIAQRAAKAALDKATEMNKFMSVSVVDESGRLVLTLKGDAAGFLTTETSRAKAVAAASFKRATMDMVELQKTNPFWNHVPVISRGEALPTGGAVPVMMNGRVIGGIGLGGGTPEEDHVCAMAGAAAVAASNTTSR
jgi:glc operon protein GlcG